MNGRRPERPPPGHGVKFVIEFGPLAVFFAANFWGAELMAAHGSLAIFGQPIFLATAGFMAASALSLAVGWLLTGRVAMVPLISAVVVAVFGGLTLWLNDETFIKIKPTLVNGLLGGGLLTGLAFGKSYLSIALGAALRLDDEGWRRLTWRWGLFFLALAALNEIVWRTQSTDVWVAFKVWGILPLTLVFALAQTRLVSRHQLEDEADG